MAKRATKPPEWFRREDYEPARTFDERDWAEMLRRRAEYRIYFRILLSPLDGTSPPPPPTAAWQAAWGDYLNDVVPSRYSEHPDRFRLQQNFEVSEEITICDVSGFYLRPATSEYEELMISLRDDLGSTFRRWEQSLLKLLVVNPYAPDESLKRDFALWLEEIRPMYPIPVQKRGPKPTNIASTEITPVIIESWKNYNVLAVIDLDIYAVLFGEEQLSYKAVSDIVAEFSDKDWGRRARDKAKEALGCAYALMAQAKGGAK